MGNSQTNGALSLEQVQLVEAHYEVARRAASKYAHTRRLDPSDCLSAAHEGLLEAAVKFDSSRGVPFAPFAHMTIGFRLLDLSRSTGVLTVDQTKVLQKANETGLTTTDDPLVNLFLLTGGDTTIPLEEHLEAQLSHIEAPEHEVTRNCEWDFLKDCIESLPSEMAQLILHVHWHEYSFKEAAELLGITPTKAHKLYQRSLEYIRDALIVNEFRANPQNGTFTPSIERVSADRKLFLNNLRELRQSGGRDQSIDPAEVVKASHLALVGSLATIPLISLHALIDAQRAA